jgi:hypothetical protein
MSFKRSPGYYKKFGQFQGICNSSVKQGNLRRRVFVFIPNHHIGGPPTVESLQLCIQYQRVCSSPLYLDSVSKILDGYSVCM